MKKQILIVGIIVFLIAVGLSGCNQITNSGVNIKLVNNCDKEIYVTLTVFGGAIDTELDLLSQINNTDHAYIATGGEETVHFDNLILDFDDQSSVSVWWNLQVNTSLGHSSLYTLQEADNATSPSILQSKVITLTFHQDGTITKEG
jgi:predicted small secreted protein